MDKEKIRELLLTKKSAKLLDVMEIAGKFYAKTLIFLNEEGRNFDYKYYEIENENIKDLDQEKLQEIKSFFETNLGNIVY